VPIYVFRCSDCRHDQELLLALGDTEARPCPNCGGKTTLRPGRVAVRYNAWGFSSTDSLVGDTRGKNFRSLRDKADQIADD